MIIIIIIIMTRVEIQGSCVGVQCYIKPRFENMTQLWKGDYSMCFESGKKMKTSRQFKL